MYKSTSQPVVAIPNLNGGDALLAAVESLQAQSLKPYIIIVDNASTDGSTERVLEKYPDLEIIRNPRNLGFAGGVNPGLRRAIELGAKFAGPFNDDAVADKHWLQQLVDYLNANPRCGAAAPKVITSDRERLDSTGDFYTDWGLPYPRGRREYDLRKYDAQTDIFAATGAASLYRVKALQEVGLFDEDFFAYYEDVDLSFRLQLAGWKVAFVPGSTVRHYIGMTGARSNGFYARQTQQNLPLLWFKNVPRRYLWHVGVRLWFALLLFFGRAVLRGQGWPAFIGALRGWCFLLKKIPARRRIQHRKKVTGQYIWDQVVHDLPPKAGMLRGLRTAWRKLIRKG